MKKNMAIILILVAVVLCSCPSILYAVGTFYYSSSPELVSAMITTGAQTTGGSVPQGDINSVVTFVRLSAGCLLCLGILIPVIVGFITLRMARKKEEQVPPIQ
jgi:hypothetical protein